MQHQTIQIRDKLLTGIDQEYNVVNMGVVIDVLSQLENIPITKEALEISRLGKHINGIRRKALDKNLANRAKSLVKKWRQLLVVSSPAVPASGADHSHQNHLVNGNSKPFSRVLSPKLETTQKCGQSPGLRPAGGVSSLPSSASTSPSRPSTPSVTVVSSSQPVSPYLRSSQGTACLSNKRTFTQRCDDSPVLINGQDSKRPRLNGNSSFNIVEDSFLSMSDSNANNLNSSAVSGDATPQMGAEVSETQSARRKSRAARLKEQEDILRQRMDSVKKSLGKVRTTQELVEEMARKSHSPGYLTPIISSRTPAPASPNQLNEETKTELMNRFLDSQQEASPPSSLSEEKEEPEEKPPKSETVEDVLSRLPPIDVPLLLAEIEEQVVQEEEEDFEVEGLIPVMPKPRPEVGPELVENLHDGQKESFNGNFNHEGEFKEWFEVVSKRTKDDELLYILPYSVID